MKTRFALNCFCIACVALVASSCIEIHGGGHIARAEGEGLYGHDVVQAGKALSLSAPAGFSYEIRFDDVDVAAVGDTHSEDMDDLSKEQVSLLQEQYANSILAGIDKAVAKTTPDWVGGKDFVVIKPNYYDGGDADSFNVTISKDEFPYSSTSAAGKSLHDSLLQLIQKHWSDVTSD